VASMKSLCVSMPVEAGKAVASEHAEEAEVFSGRAPFSMERAY